MAQENVNIKVTADMAEAIRAWQEVQKGPKGMANEMAAMGKKGKTATRGLTTDLAKMAAGWFSVQAGINLAKDALQFYITANKEAAQQSRTATREIDDNFRKLLVQAQLGSNDKERAATLKKLVGGSAKTAAVSFSDAANVARSLVSTGFSLEQVEGGALDVALAAINATNVTGKNADPEQFTRSIVSLLNSSGQEKTTANFRRAAIAIQSNFRSGNLEPQDLPALAESSSKLTNFANVPLNEQIALLTTLKETNTSGAKAATGLGNIAQILGTASENAAVKKGLRQAGIDPEEVDFEGEHIGQVLDLFADRLGKLTPEKRKGAVGQIFGRDTAGIFFDLIAGRQKFRKFAALTKDEAGFNTAVGIATTGAAAAERRTELATQLSFDDEGLARRARLGEVLATKGKQQGLSNVRIAGTKLLVEGIQGSAPALSDTAVAATAEATVLTAKKAAGILVNPARGLSDLFFDGELEAGNQRVGAAAGTNTANEINVNVTGELTDARGAHQGNVSAVQGANEE